MPEKEGRGTNGRKKRKRLKNVTKSDKAGEGFFLYWSASYRFYFYFALCVKTQLALGELCVRLCVSTFS